MDGHGFVMTFKGCCHRQNTGLVQCFRTDLGQLFGQNNAIQKLSRTGVSDRLRIPKLS